MRAKCISVTTKRGLQAFPFNHLTLNEIRTFVPSLGVTVKSATVKGSAVGGKIESRKTTNLETM